MNLLEYPKKRRIKRLCNKAAYYAGKITVLQLTRPISIMSENEIDKFADLCGKMNSVCYELEKLEKRESENFLKKVGIKF